MKREKKKEKKKGKKKEELKFFLSNQPININIKKQ